MGKFNLLDEPWISVITDSKGKTELISLMDLFKNAHQYIGLGGDTKTQDFAIIRVLLAVLHTVFSRFNVDGEVHDGLQLDEMWKPVNEIEDIEEYINELKKTWISLWRRGEFPNIVIDYLEKWRDHFYLFDEKFPFYQVPKDVIGPGRLNKDNPSAISGKNINRLISESGNKIAIFSPKYDSRGNKEIMSSPDIARWIITFQGYTGLSDKVIFGSDKYKASKGWLFDIGSITLGGNNLFETLMLNLMLTHPENSGFNLLERPCWEFEPEKVVSKLLTTSEVNNLSELYTNWSRAVYINPDIDLNKPFEIKVVKLPEIRHQNQFLEAMTLWKFNKSGDNKDKFTPRKHKFNQSIWRSFGLITASIGKEESKIPFHRPGIMQWLNNIERVLGDYRITLISISMEDDGNATSWVPVNDIVDSLTINDMVVTDLRENGWVPRVNGVIEDTKSVIGFIYKNFIQEMKDIRNLSSKEFVNEKVEELYFLVDQPFREWISSLKVTDSMDEKVFEWKQTLYHIVLNQAKTIFKEAGNRDYVGIRDEKGKRVKNIATAYNSFTYFLNKKMKIKEAAIGRQL